MINSPSSTCPLIIIKNIYDNQILYFEVNQRASPNGSVLALCSIINLKSKPSPDSGLILHLYEKTCVCRTTCKIEIELIAAFGIWPFPEVNAH